MFDTNNRNYVVNEVEHCWIPISDGIRLSARLWLPETPHSRPTPAVLEYIPYRKRDMVRLRDERNHPYFARHGYACVRVDMRGSGDSEGLMVDMYGPEELKDGVEIIEWIAKQPWCDGNVGMMGTSWGGTSCLQIASLQPDALKAIIAVCSTDNRFEDDIHHMGGCLLTDTVEWGATLPVILASPPDPATVGSDWRRIWQERLAGCEFPLKSWVKHETRDAYWRRGSVSEVPGSITCPMLLVGGWVDRYSNTVMNLLSESDNQCWGIIGPWGHHYPDVGVPKPDIDFQQEAVRWWDRWLMGKDNGMDEEPQLRVWLQEYVAPSDKILQKPGKWISENTWPSSNVKPKNYQLSSGELQTSDHTNPTETAFVPNTVHVGLTAGDTGYFGRDGGLPLDQREDDVLCLVFDTAPLKEPLDILGHTVLHVSLEVDQPIATLAVRLNDVSPTGEIGRVTYAIRNLALDQIGEGCQDLKPHEPRQICIEFPNVAYRFAKGHRIRLAFSSAYWPLIWPSPKLAEITLHLAKTQLTLPIRPENLAEKPIQFAKSDHAGESESSVLINNQALQRWSNLDATSNIISTGWHQPLTRVQFRDIDLQLAYETRAEHKITVGDPNSAFSRVQHRLQFSRNDSIVEVVGTAQLHSTLTDYVLSGSLEVLENGELIFERQWNPSLDRMYS
ncbi:uncharacterized protein METZ01_LOCUS94067 [marine metagenome]|uniref:Xaa-Pro dipeptidyl-peptidase C-terminal domain-containing protein n=1 Tax=marine metagenome TaxID=408172 RepID=A0A381VNX9_9ZZZZ